MVSHYLGFTFLSAAMFYCKCMVSHYLGFTFVSAAMFYWKYMVSHFNIRFHICICCDVLLEVNAVLRVASIEGVELAEHPPF